MAAPSDGLLAPLTALVKRRRGGARGAAATALEELDGVLDAVPAAIIAQAPDGSVHAWNRAAERLFGWTRAQMAGASPQFVPPEERSSEAAQRRRILAGNEIFRAPGRYRHADGETLNLLVSAAPRRDEAGKIVGIVSILEEAVGATRSDLAVPVPAPQQEEDRRDPLRFEAPSQPRWSTPAQAQPSQFLAKVSHDLRQPLHALSLLTGALERRVKEPAARELVDDAGRMIRALQSTFDNLVDLTRLEEGSVQAQPAAVPANDILAPLAAEFAREAERRNIALRHVGSSAVIRVDPLLTQRLLRQLLANALRFAAREDGSGARVLLGARRAGDRLRLIVADDGIGIPTDQQEAIFAPFVQSDAGRAAGGLGLGLAVAGHLARLNATAIKLRSEPGKGSLFWIDVPLEKKPA